MIMIFKGQILPFKKNKINQSSRDFKILMESGLFVYQTKYQNTSTYLQ